MNKSKKPSYIDQALKEAEAIFAQALDKEALKIAVDGLLKRKILESFKNGIETGKKRGYKGK